MPRQTTPLGSDPTGALIARLVDDLEAVKPLRNSTGFGLTLLVLVATIALVCLVLGVRADVVAERLDPLFLIATGLVLTLGLASTAATIAMSRPQIGSIQSGWRWAALAATVLPAAAFFAGLGRSQISLSVESTQQGLACVAAGSGFGVGTLAALVWWLRRGAPTMPEQAGLLTGIAAGSFGALAYSFHCPSSDIVHIGLWHGMTVAVSAFVCRFAVPPLIRW